MNKIEDKDTTRILFKLASHLPSICDGVSAGLLGRSITEERLLWVEGESQVVRARRARDNALAAGDPNGYFGPYIHMKLDTAENCEAAALRSDKPWADLSDCAYVAIKGFRP